jgi:hypothetical protein
MPATNGVITEAASKCTSCGPNGTPSEKRG